MAPLAHRLLLTVKVLFYVVFANALVAYMELYLCQQLHSAELVLSQHFANLPQHVLPLSISVEQHVHHAVQQWLIVIPAAVQLYVPLAFQIAMLSSQATLSAEHVAQ